MSLPSRRVGESNIAPVEGQAGCANQLAIQEPDNFTRAAVPNFDRPFGALVDVTKHHEKDAPIDVGPQITKAGIEIGLGYLLAAIKQPSRIQHG
ncbi:hypothetical protein ASD34_22565 [Variovorax sp. Root473]|nr:hypothetical protein ASD34_22565 [Variovorax sp. Root473]